MSDEQRDVLGPDPAGGVAPPAVRPVMVAIAGDSGTGKTTLTKGLVEAVGRDRIASMAADDYHRYDREERKSLPFTPLHPKCNYMDIMENHLAQLRTGRRSSSPSTTTTPASSSGPSTWSPVTS